MRTRRTRIDVATECLERWWLIALVYAAIAAVIRSILIIQ